MKTKTLFSSKKMDWETPKWLFNQLNEEFQFMHDLAATKENHLTPFYFTEEDDALSCDWYPISHWCFLNPPYGQTLKHWVAKCDAEAELGTKIVALLPGRIDTKYFHEHIYRKYEVRPIKGRLKFLSDGEEMDAAPFPSMIVIFKKDSYKEWLLGELKRLMI